MMASRRRGSSPGPSEDNDLSATSAAGPRALTNTLVWVPRGECLVGLRSHTAIAQVQMLRSPEPAGNQHKKGEDAQHRACDVFEGSWQH